MRGTVSVSAGGENEVLRRRRASSRDVRDRYRFTTGILLNPGPKDSGTWISVRCLLASAKTVTFSSF
jgi:hypothetical protein